MVTSLRWEGAPALRKPFAGNIVTVIRMHDEGPQPTVVGNGEPNFDAPLSTSYGFWGFNLDLRINGIPLVESAIHQAITGE